MVGSSPLGQLKEFDKYLNPMQKPVDFTPIDEKEDVDFSGFNYFQLSNDPEYPIYKPSDPNFAVKDDKYHDLQFFMFEPAYLNFTERYILFSQGLLEAPCL